MSANENDLPRDASRLLTLLAEDPSRADLIRATVVDALGRKDIDDLEAAILELDDAPELTDDWFREADTFDGPELVRRGRPKSAAPKQAINIRLSPEVLAFFKAGGKGWQSRIDAALKDHVVKHEQDIAISKTPLT